MANLSARHLYLRADGGKRAIGGQRVGKKRLLQPQNTRLLEGGNASGRTITARRKDLAGSDQNLSVAAPPRTCRLDMACVLLDGAPAIIAPADLHGTEP